MMGPLSDGFAALLRRKATDEEIRRLYEVKNALGLADNDALWVVLIALEHYDTLFKEYPARIADAARRTLEEVQKSFSVAAALEAKRAHRQLAEMVADASIEIASKRSSVVRVHGFVAAAALLIGFGGLCLAMGNAIGAGRLPAWSHGSGGRRLASAALGAPIGWVLVLLLIPLSALWMRYGVNAARAPQAKLKDALAGWTLAALAGVGMALSAVVVWRYI